MKYEYIGDRYGNEREQFDSVDEFKAAVLDMFDCDEDVEDELARMTMRSDGHWYVEDEMILRAMD